MPIAHSIASLHFSHPRLERERERERERELEIYIFIYREKERACKVQLIASAQRRNYRIRFDESTLLVG
jgi:hypothetical protein